MTGPALALGLALLIVFVGACVAAWWDERMDRRAHRRVPHSARWPEDCPDCRADAAELSRLDRMDRPEVDPWLP